MALGCCVAAQAAKRVFKAGVGLALALQTTISASMHLGGRKLMGLFCSGACWLHGRCWL